MMSSEDRTVMLGQVVTRLDSVDQLLVLVDRCFAALWRTAGPEGKNSIHNFQKALQEHRKRVAKLSTRDGERETGDEQPL